ncbi:MAG TPA: hypothetical protein DEH11_16410 [Actinobacteria bacterium]|nr:hypothetical protein [Actinomycetota bacterium]
MAGDARCGRGRCAILDSRYAATAALFGGSPLARSPFTCSPVAGTAPAAGPAPWADVAGGADVTGGADRGRGRRTGTD